MGFGQSANRGNSGGDRNDGNDQVAYNILFQGSCGTCTINVVSVITVFQQAGHHGTATTGLGCPKCGRVVSAVGYY